MGITTSFVNVFAFSHKTANFDVKRIIRHYTQMKTFLEFKMNEAAVECKKLFLVGFLCLQSGIKMYIWISHIGCISEDGVPCCSASLDEQVQLL